MGAGQVWQDFCKHRGRIYAIKHELYLLLLEWLETTAC